jgi:hypothetical protein
LVGNQDRAKCADLDYFFNSKRMGLKNKDCETSVLGTILASSKFFSSKFLCAPRFFLWYKRITMVCFLPARVNA